MLNIRRCVRVRVCAYLGGLLCARGQLISEDDAGGQSFDSYSERMRKEEKDEEEETRRD